jgi:hypothetical protein
MAINEYRIFGIQTATIGGVFPLMANVADTVWNKIYEKLNAKPTPKYNPMPPLTFLEERDAPIMVRMKEAKDMAMRL